MKNGQSHPQNGAHGAPADSASRVEEAIRSAVKAEREACARLAEDLGLNFVTGGLARAADDIAIAIRKRDRAREARAQA